MIVRVPDIPAEGLNVVETTALGTVYRDPAWRLDDVRLRLERDGLDVFVTGELRATVSQTCGRCLEPSAVTVTTAIDVRLCPVCGGNRNAVACACPPRPPDPRLAVLKDLAARLPH